MSDNLDDHDMNFTEGEGEAPAAAKPKGAGPGILRILMFVGIALGAVILIVTVVVITTSVINGQGKAMAEAPVTESYQEAPPVYSYFTTIAEIRTRSADTVPASLVVKVNLGFDTSDTKAPAEMTERRLQMQDFLRGYFSKKRFAELQPANEAQLKEEIKAQLNTFFSKRYVREVLFERFDVIPGE
jgi:flagellar FliL protein